MEKIIKYKGYYTIPEYSPNDEVFFGKIEGIRGLILFEADSAKDIKKAFYEAVDEYIEDCKNEGIAPEKPFKGTFNVRIGEELHQKAAIYAENHNTSLNNLVKEALELLINEIEVKRVTISGKKPQTGKSKISA
jgi:predicted HicB family RNase H-like nuclease